jgi:type IX secretion system PorP/SprF family membrane protein
MRIVLVTGCLVALSQVCLAQYFQFSQYNFTDQRINPATVSSSNYAGLSFINRNQSTGGGFHLNSNFFNATYPFINRRGLRWSGVGISLMDDRAGQSGLFSTQEVGLSYAISVPVTKGTTVSLGVKALHARHKVDVDGLRTGSQYVPYRGFDESVSNGENFGRINNSFNTFSAGIYWRKEDKNRNTVTTGGISFFDFNKPDESFSENPASYASSIVASLSHRIYYQGKISIYPEILATLAAGKPGLNSGFVTSFELKNYRRGPSDKLDLITKYRSRGTALLGFQFHKENLSIGVSYDFPVSGRLVSNHGALEVGVAMRRLIEGKKRRNLSRASSRNGSIADKKPRSVPVRNQPDSLNSNTKNVPAASLSERLKSKRDSVAAVAVPGSMTHEPLILEKASLHFNFQFNSTTLGPDAQEYLDEVARALIDNPELRVELIGHTDNIGSSKFNLKLSLLRAESMKVYLVEQGVSESRVMATGKGMTEPLNENITEAERALNRRVEMKIMYGR